MDSTVSGLSVLAREAVPTRKAREMDTIFRALTEVPTKSNGPKQSLVQASN